MIGGMIKYFRFSYEYVLWGISYSNLQMLIATVPTYKDLKKDEDKQTSPEMEFADIFKDETQWQ